MKRRFQLICCHGRTVFGLFHLYYYSSPVRKNLSSKSDRFLPARSQIETNHRVICLRLHLANPLPFCICPLFFYDKKSSKTTHAMKEDHSGNKCFNTFLCYPRFESCITCFTYIFKSRFVTLYGFYQIKYIQSVSIGVIDQVRSANDDPNALLQSNR